MSNGPEFVFEVPPLSWHQIDEVALDVRAALGHADVKYFQVDWVLEKALEALIPGYAFDVGDAQMMGGAEGQTAPDGSFVRLREDVYVKMLEGDGRARFTAAHELGHYFLHQNVPLQRTTAKSIPAYRNAEVQANRFAACILMPARLIDRGMSARDMMGTFGVSAKAAQNRYDGLNLKGISGTGRAANSGSPPNLFSRD